MNAIQIINTLKSDKITHKSRGFNITYFHGDNEFNIEALRYSWRLLIFQIYAKDEHVISIEKAIDTVKERTCSMCNAVPYKKYTRIIPRYLVEGSVELLNYFLSKNRYSATMRASLIMEGKVKIYMGLKMIEFESYEMVYVRTKDTMKIRSIP